MDYWQGIPSLYIDIQPHSGHVAFRNIRMKRL
jgi:hypothetical protein